MSRQIFEQHVDERGNVSVRISDECVVLTHEEAERIKAKFDQLQAENSKLIVKLNAEHIVRQNVEVENAKLREYAAKAWGLFIRHGAVHTYDLSEVDAVRDGLHELGIEVN